MLRREPVLTEYRCRFPISSELSVVSCPGLGSVSTYPLEVFRYLCVLYQSVLCEPHIYISYLAIPYNPYNISKSVDFSIIIVLTGAG